MNVYLVVFVIAVAAVLFFVWSQRKRPDASSGTPARLPAAPAPVPAPPPAATTAAPAADGSPGSYDEYRKVNPSNMLQGKLTCNRCGSNLIRSAGGIASCASCGAALYRA